LKDGVNYDQISPYASIPLPQRLKKQRDEKESLKFLTILESLGEDEYLYDVEVEEREWLDEEGVLVDIFELLVEDTPMENAVDFEVEQVLANPNQLINDRIGKRVENKEVKFDILEKKEPLVEKHPCMMEEVVDLLNEGVVKKNIMEFEGSKEDKECMAILEVKPIVLYVHSKYFFEESANYILQPPIFNPILSNLLLEETTMIPFDPPFV
jgi:hypothetical protein